MKENDNGGREKELGEGRGGEESVEVQGGEEKGSGGRNSVYVTVPRTRCGVTMFPEPLAGFRRERRRQKWIEGGEERDAPTFLPSSPREILDKSHGCSQWRR